MKQIRVLTIAFSILLIQTTLGFSQQIIIKPSSSITPYYTLDEWIFANANWGYDSYDLVNFEPFTNLFTSTLESAPIIFVNGNRFHANWANQDLLTLPNIPIDLIDSVVVSPYKKITNGFLTLNGSIEIFLNDEKERFFYEKSQTNQVNDPGPHVSSNLSTPNVEFVNRRRRISLSYPRLLNTNFILLRDKYARTNPLIYDRERNFELIRRTISSTPSGSQRLPRNIDRDFILTNRFDVSSATVRTNLSYTHTPQKYPWIPLAGIEVPISNNIISASASVQNNKDAIFKQTQFNFKYTDTDSIANTAPATYGVNEILFSHSSSFLIPAADASLSFHVNSSSFMYEDNTTNRSETIHDINLISEYKSKRFGTMNIALGNHTLGGEYQRSLSNSWKINLSTFRRDLEANGYNFTFLNRGIGFVNLDRANHSVANNSDFVQTYSLAELHTSFKKSIYSIRGTLFSKYYWNFVNTDIQYSFNTNSRQLSSIITYSDIKNVGFVGFNISMDADPSSKIALKSSLSGHVFRFGNNEFIDNARNINTVLFSQSIHYRAHENALFELNFRYISPRDILEFEPLESNPAFPTAHVRPIYLLNATAKTWVYNKSASLAFSLRNLLNSTESYNTNGQYYNMSIHVTASLNLNRNLFRN